MPTTRAFKKLEKSIELNYLGRPVPTRFLKDYGKIYNKKDLLPLSIRTAKSRGVQIDK